MAEEELRRGEDGGERIAQVVADDPDELLAEARRHLRLLQVALALGDVGGDGDGARDRPERIAQGGDRYQEVERAAVLSFAVHLGGHDAARRARLGVEREPLLLRALVGAGRIRLPDHLGARETGDLFRRPVPDAYLPVAVEGDDRQRRGLDELLETLGEIAGGALGPAALADVAQGYRPEILAVDPRHRHFDRQLDPAAMPRGHLQAAAEHASRRLEPLQEELALGLAQLGGEDEIGEIVPERFVAGVSEDPLGGGVPFQDP